MHKFLNLSLESSWPVNGEFPLTLSWAGLQCDNQIFFKMTSLFPCVGVLTFKSMNHR